MTSRSLSLVLLLVLALIGSSVLYVIQETELGDAAAVSQAAV